MSSSSRVFTATALTIFAVSMAQSQSAFAQARAVRRHPQATAPAVTANAINAPAVTAQRMQEPASASEVRSGLRFEAFADGELRLSSDDITDKGFSLNDAALYVSRDFGGGVKAMIDLPFSSTGGNTSAFTFADSRAQAYFQFTRDQVSGKFGQFDSTFGVELNDSRDRFFADAGWIKNALLPKVHTGATVAYGTSTYTVRGLVANPHDTGTMLGRNPELGAQFRLDTPQAYASAGVLWNDAKNVASGNTTDLLVDIMGGLKADRFQLDGSIDLRKVPGSDKNGLGVGVFGSLRLDEALALGGRIEYLKDVVIPGTATVAADSAFTIAVGPSYKLTNELTLRGDLGVGNIKPSVGDSKSLFAATFSVVASL